MKRLILIFCFFISVSTQLSAQTYQLQGNEVVINDRVAFETGTAKLLPESETVLSVIRQYLIDKSYISLLRVEGHVTGTDKDQQLSESRAAAVCAWLVKNGVDCKRLIPVGFGHTKPVADDATPEGKAQNSHISFINAALRGHLIGGMDADGGGKIAGDPCNP
ncbi:OmpA family protein [Chitinophagaceae bacterium MMS25-I14]